MKTFLSPVLALAVGLTASLAIGAPEPWRELPRRLERMIHFVPPHNEKMRGKVPDSCGLACMTASIASSISPPISRKASCVAI